MLSTMNRPSPGYANTVSVNTAPPSKYPVCTPTIVSTGIMALRKACRTTV